MRQSLDLAKAKRSEPAGLGAGGIRGFEVVRGSAILSVSPFRDTTFVQEWEGDL